jgi:peptidoglycan/LPS O-acetylase OafA/YrhL
MNRRADIDWLRVGATYLLFVFHVGKVFDPAPFFHIQNDERSVVMLILCGFINLWHMPLFFLLAGWSAASSLEVRGAGGFARERLHRLGVPLVAGCVLLAPVIKFLELRSGFDLNHQSLRVAIEHQDSVRMLIPHGLPIAEPFHESFVAFLPTFFTQLDRFTWSHLWFVAYLLALTIVWLPLFVWLRRGSERIRTWPAWSVYVPLVPLVIVQLTMRGRWPGIYNLYNDWANVAYFSVFLLSGFFLACHRDVENVIAREWKRSLALGAVATGILLLGVLRVFSSPPVLLVGTAVAGWCFVIALLGMARRHFTASTPALAYLSESAFPVYVLHQAAIVLPGYLLVGLPLGIVTKFVLLLLLAVTITMGTYHWLVRPFAAPRFLLGMRPKASPLPRRVALSPSTVS